MRAITLLQGRLYGVHLKDFAEPKKDAAGVILGKGQLDVAGTFRALRKVEFPADPLRIFRVSDGKRVASLGSFPGGLRASGLTWSPSGEYLPFTMQLALSASGIRFNRGFPWWLRAGAKSISAAGIFCSPRMVPSWPQISPMA